MSTLTKKPSARKPTARRMAIKAAVGSRPLPPAKGTTKDLSARSETFGHGVDLSMVAAMVAGRSNSSRLRSA